MTIKGAILKSLDDNKTPASDTYHTTLFLSFPNEMDESGAVEFQVKFSYKFSSSFYKYITSDKYHMDEVLFNV